MLVTQQKILRRFWYPIVPADRLTDAPLPFTLLGTNIVLFRDAARPRVGADRPLLPSHRHAQQRLARRRQHRLPLSRLDLCRRRTLRAHPAAAGRRPRQGHRRRGVPLHRALRRRLGGARGAVARHPRAARIRRPGLSPRLRVLRAVVGARPAHHGEQLRQRPLRLRAQGELRHRRRARAGAAAPRTPSRGLRHVFRRAGEEPRHPEGQSRHRLGSHGAPLREDLVDAVQPQDEGDLSQRPGAHHHDADRADRRPPIAGHPVPAAQRQRS